MTRNGHQGAEAQRRGGAAQPKPGPRRGEFSGGGWSLSSLGGCAKAVPWAVGLRHQLGIPEGPDCERVQARRRDDPPQVHELHAPGFSWRK